MVLVFMGVVFGVLAGHLLSDVFWCCVTGLGLLSGHSRGQRSSDVVYVCAFGCARSFTLLSIRGILCSLHFLVFFPSLLSF